MIRFVNTDDISDARAILNIYAPHILYSDVTFECTVPTEEEFLIRIKHYTEQFPYLIYELDGEIAGYAYAGKQREREAFQWNAEISVYVAEKYQRRGIAGELYTVLLKILAVQGYKTAYACITYPNDKSIAFHNKFGFTETAMFRHTGYKLGKWHDTIWLEKQLGEYESEPVLPVPFPLLDKGILFSIINNSD
ncbi:MAG TPA: N-acetyltransferase family protein [Oscillospiraceae bacterium]|nr:N-acetyltransferase family protein [Oscillospiraceae bacterium]